MVAFGRFVRVLLLGMAPCLAWGQAPTQQPATQLDTITLSASAPTEAGLSNRQQLTALQREQAYGKPLATSLALLPGASVLATGSTIQKPVVRGLHSLRLPVLINGLRFESQRWGMDHAPEIDPFFPYQPTLLQQGGGLRYGSDAFGGIVLLEPLALPTRGWQARLHTQYASQGHGLATAATFEHAPRSLPGLSYRLHLMGQQAGNLRAPGYYLPNTGTRQLGMAYQLGYQRKAWALGLLYSRYTSQLGVLQTSHTGSINDFRAALERGRPLDDGTFTYDIARPRQEVLHELLQLTASTKLGKHRLELALARQFNRRLEYDLHRGFNTPSGAQLQFGLTTYSAELNLSSPISKHITSSVGTSVQTQRNTYTGAPLLPYYTTTSLAAYQLLRYKRGPWQLAAGWRLEHHNRRLDPLPSDSLTTAALPQTGLALGLQARYVLGGTHIFSAALQRLWRPPAVAELATGGVHHGSATYELGLLRQGNALQAERAWGLNLNYELLPVGKLSAYAELYGQRFDAFINLAPAQPAEGGPTTVTTIRGTFPLYTYSYQQAWHYGGSLLLRYELSPAWQLGAKGQLVRIQNNQGEGLVGVPSDELALHLRWQKASGQQLPNYIQLGFRQVFANRHAPAWQATDFAPPPGYYALLDLSAGWHISPQLRAEAALENLLNRTYRDYLDRYRYYAAAPGITAQLRLTYSLNSTSQ